MPIIRSDHVRRHTSGLDVRRLVDQSARVALMCGCLVVLPCETVESAVFHCAGGDVPCLISAINESNINGEANTIRLEAGTYSLTEHGLAIGGSVAIIGVAAEATIIERADYLIPAPPPFRIFQVAATGRLLLDDVTVRGGDVRPVGSGGAIVSAGTLTVTDSIIRNNRAGRAGAVEIDAGEFTLRDSRITNNGVGLGGDILRINGVVSAKIVRSSISQNTFQEGAAINIDGGARVTITDSDISHNRCFSCGADVIRALLDQTPDGPQGVVTIANSTIANNILGVFGGVGVSAGPNVFISSSTIANNGDLDGGNRGVTSRIAGSPLIHNSIVGSCDWFPVFPDAGPPTSLGHNMFGTPQGCGTLLPSDLVGDVIVDSGGFPVTFAGLGGFIDSGRPGGGYLPLLAGSQPIDAGDNAACGATDQPGLSRPVDGNGDGVRTCDIGAVEFYPLVNDLVQLTAVTGRYVPPPSPGEPVHPLAAGGQYQIDAVFTNVAGRDICNLSFDVATLQGASAFTGPVMLAPDGSLLGGQGAMVPATLAGGAVDLKAQQQQQYRFTIGVGAAEAITVFVNVLGEATAGPCDP